MQPVTISLQSESACGSELWPQTLIHDTLGCVAEMVTHTESVAMHPRTDLLPNKAMPEPELVERGVAPLPLDSEWLDLTVYVRSLLMPDVLLSHGQVSVAVEAYALSLPSCHLPHSLKH